jgi:hypothetical protein
MKWWWRWIAWPKAVGAAAGLWSITAAWPRARGERGVRRERRGRGTYRGAWLGRGVRVLVLGLDRTASGEAVAAPVSW